jgi:hypothetical protein
MHTFGHRCFPGGIDDALFVGVVRDPVQWAMSLVRHRGHLPGGWLCMQHQVIWSLYATPSHVASAAVAALWPPTPSSRYPF